MKTPHPHAEIIKAFVEDTSVVIERKHPDSLVWKPADIEDVLNIRGETGKHEFRLKPAMRSITLADGTVVSWPEPMRVAPNRKKEIRDENDCVTVVLTTVWLALPIRVSPFIWSDSIDDFKYLKAGFCHLTEEAAQQHRKALVLANGGEL